MRLHLRVRDLPRPAALLEYVERRVRFDLSRFSSRIAAVHVTLADDNGPRGGIDKTCRATARMEGAASITVTSADQDARAAVDRTVARLARSVRRSIERRVDHDGTPSRSGRSTRLVAGTGWRSS